MHRINLLKFAWNINKSRWLKNTNFLMFLLMQWHTKALLYVYILTNKQLLCLHFCYDLFGLTNTLLHSKPITISFAVYVNRNNNNIGQKAAIAFFCNVINWGKRLRVFAFSLFLRWMQAAFSKYIGFYMYMCFVLSQLNLCIVIIIVILFFCYILRFILFVFCGKKSNNNRVRLL